jgi:hypothetical protein
MWQKHPPSDGMTHAGAVQYCENLVLAGHDDWYLPTALELVSLLDPSKSNVAIDPVAFPGTPAQTFWTASLNVGLTDNAWMVNFKAPGETFSATRPNKVFVRCVRGTGACPPKFVDDGVWVRDERTKLQWQKHHNSEQLDWTSAKGYCTWAGGRAPTVRELISIVDFSRHGVKVDPEYFPGTAVSWFWTSTANPSNVVAFRVLSGTGQVSHTTLEVRGYIRCVR